MSELPSSPETHGSSSQDAAEAAQENVTAASALAGMEDMPDIDPDQYLADQERAQRRARMIGRFLLGFIPVILIFAYLGMTGRLSRNRLSNVIHGRSNDTRPKSDFSVVTPPDGSNPNPSAALNSAVAAATKPDPVIAQDLKDYVYRDLQSVHTDERTALVAFAGVTGKSFKNRQTTYQALKDTVIPAYSRFLEKAEAIHPKTPAVQQIHRYFVDSAAVKLLGFKHMLEDQDVPDNLWRFGVSADFNASSQLANQFKIQINQLAQHQGVKLP